MAVVFAVAIFGFLYKTVRAEGEDGYCKNLPGGIGGALELAGSTYKCTVNGIPQCVPNKTACDALQERVVNAAVETVTGKTAGGWIQAGLNYILSWIMWLASWFLWYAAMFFNGMISISLNLGGKFPEVLKVAEAGWTLLRDVSNIVFIFVILYIAIRTILSIGGGFDKKLLTNVILIALLINFSLFFTKVIVDVSNTLAIAFYNPILTEAKEGLNKKEVTDSDSLLNASFVDGGVSDLIMNKLQLTTLYKVDNSTGQIQNLGTEEIEDNSMVYIMGTIFILVAAFVFFAGGILFFLRTLNIIFLMILAPLAWVAYILPGAQKYWGQWWSKLLAEAQFAPIFTLLILVSIRGLDILDSSAFFVNNGGKLTPESIGQADTGVFATVFIFLIVIGLLVASLKVAKDLGVAGGKAGVSFATKSAGKAVFGAPAWLARKSVGKVGDTIARNENSQIGARLKLMADSDSKLQRSIGRFGMDTADKASKASFDLRAAKIGDYNVTGELDAGKAEKGGYKKSVDDYAKKMDEKSKLYGSLTAEEKERVKKWEEENKKIEGNVTSLKNRMGEYQKLLKNSSGEAAKDIEEMIKGIKTDITKEENKISGNKKEIKNTKESRERKFIEDLQNPGFIGAPLRSILQHPKNAGNKVFGINLQTPLPRKLSESASKINKRLKGEDKELKKKIKEALGEDDKNKGADDSGGDEKPNDEKPE